MSHRTCDESGCERKHVAKGMCHAHYNAWHKKQPGYKRTSYDFTCEVCGTAAKGSRKTQRFCSDACKGRAYKFEKRTRPRELVYVGPAYPVTTLPPQHPVIRGVPTYKKHVWYGGKCQWCDETFLCWQPASRYCSRQCASRAGEARRGRFIVPRHVRLGIYERDKWTCQLCMEPVDRDLMTTDPLNDWAPSLDHIECQAWTLVPNHSEGNLQLAHRWCNAVRGDESYYRPADLRPAG